jgi:hypothetical protein
MRARLAWASRPQCAQAAEQSLEWGQRDPEAIHLDQFLDPVGDREEPSASMRPMLRVRTRPSRGFNLHAAVQNEAHDRKRLEQLCRYIARPALSEERAQLNAAGQVELKLKTPWHDGTTHLVT